MTMERGRRTTAGAVGSVVAFSTCLSIACLGPLAAPRDPWCFQPSPLVSRSLSSSVVLSLSRRPTATVQLQTKSCKAKREVRVCSSLLR